MKYSKIMKLVKEKKDVVSMTISDYNYMPECPDIAWQDVVSDGIWSFTQEDVYSEVMEVLTDVENKKYLSVEREYNNFVINIHTRPVSYAIYFEEN